MPLRPTIEGFNGISGTDIIGTLFQHDFARWALDYLKHERGHVRSVIDRDGANINIWLQRIRDNGIPEVIQWMQRTPMRADILAKMSKHSSMEELTSVNGKYITFIKWMEGPLEGHEINARDWIEANIEDIKLVKAWIDAVLDVKPSIRDIAENTSDTEACMAAPRCARCNGFIRYL